MLGIPISEDEVWTTIKQLPANKVFGPDAFMGRFCQTCLHIIKGDIIGAISVVWRRDFRKIWLLNTTFIMLIPKKEYATNVKDYRAISLIHSFAILIMKILANDWLIGWTT
jgi:hypothetical protein